MGLTAMSHLAVHTTCCQQFIEAGGVEAMLLILEEHRADLQVLSRTLITLRRVVKQCHISEMDKIELQVSRAGGAGGCRGVTILLNAMQAHDYDETVVKEITLLLTSLGRHSSNLDVLMSSTPFYMKILELHKNDAPTADAVAGLLAVLPVE